MCSGDPEERALKSVCAHFTADCIGVGVVRRVRVSDLAGNQCLGSTHIAIPQPLPLRRRRLLRFINLAVGSDSRPFQRR